MQYSSEVLVTAILLIVNGVSSICELDMCDDNVDPVSRQLLDYKDKTPVPASLTTTAGRPVEVIETSSLNTDILNNMYVFETLMHVVSERRPDRIWFPKATGARGYFEVKTDVTKYTKAKLFAYVGKSTPVFVRFSEGQVDKGSSDLRPYASRGMAVKFYTEDGNLDLIGINFPIFAIRDPIQFKDLLHSVEPNPQTNIRDFNSVFDFVINHPISVQALFWSVSEFSIPRGYRHMNGFPIHTFPLYNDKGETHYARFRFITDLGYDNFSLEESLVISSFDSDFFMRDLYNSIANDNCPSWTLEMDVLSTSNLSEINFDPFDVTRLWPEGSYCSVPVGSLVLDENVKNAFAEVEDSAFFPGNLVPGFNPPPDILFKGRMIAYFNAQVSRLGINYNNIPVNCPIYSNTYHRDGIPPVGSNGGDQVSYRPNSFNGPEPRVDEARPALLQSVYEESIPDFEACRQFYYEVLRTDSQKEYFINSLVQANLRVHHTLTEKLTDLLRQVDEGIAVCFSKALEKAKKNIKLPNVVADIDPNRLNPYDANYTQS